MALVNIQVPDIGDFDEVGVIELLVKVGDTVKAEQSLITVESDKASMEIPSSHHLVEKAYRWPVERAIDASVEATALAHELGLKVSFFPIDATRAGLVEYLDLLEKVASDGHVDAVVSRLDLPEFAARVLGLFADGR